MTKKDKTALVEGLKKLSKDSRLDGAQYLSL